MEVFSHKNCPLHRHKSSISGMTINWVLFFSGDCCWKVKVAFTTNNLNGAYKLHKYIFGYYTMEPGLVNGRNHYTSTHADGAFALAFCGDSWWLQSADVRGECKGWAHSGWQENRCVHDIDYSWRYFIPAIDEFVEAKKGLSVWCKSWENAVVTWSCIISVLCRIPSILSSLTFIGTLLSFFSIHPWALQIRMINCCSSFLFGKTYGKTFKQATFFQECNLQSIIPNCNCS